MVYPHFLLVTNYYMRYKCYTTGQEFGFGGYFSSKNKSKITQLTESGVVLDENNKIKLNDSVLDGSNYIDLLRFLLYGVKQLNKWGEIYEFMQINNFPNSYYLRKQSYILKNNAIGQVYNLFVGYTMCVDVRCWMSATCGGVRRWCQQLEVCRRC